MSMAIPARIIFKDGDQSQEFNFHSRSEGRTWFWPSQDDSRFAGLTWRFVADAEAVELRPLCDAEARLLTEKDAQGRLVSLPPQCDRLEIWPVRWGYPDSLVTDYPAEVEEMRQDHLAGKHGLGDSNNTWDYWLEEFGKPCLWENFATEDMKRRWLSWRTPPGCTLHTFAGQGGDRIRREILECIQFRADFHNGNRCETIWLALCAKDTLSAEEKRLAPAFIAQEEKILRKQEAVETKSGKNIARKLKLVVLEANLEAERRQRQKEDARLAKQRAVQPVTRAECCEELNVGERQLRIISKRFAVDVPQTRGQLDSLLRKDQRHKKVIAGALTARNKASAKKRRG